MIHPHDLLPDRREFLRASAAWGTGLVTATAGLGGAEPPRRPRVACLYTVLRPRSHAHVLLENFLEKYPFNGRLFQPSVDVVAMWGDQFPKGDMTQTVARQYGIPLFQTIEEALCRGGKELAVDAVLAIGEHGKYPDHRKWVTAFPRKEFFDASVAVMRRSGRFVPYFNDKQLCYRWDWAKEMYDTARQLGIPLMAGSSLPLAQRLPAFEIPPGTEIAEAMMVHGGQLENYGIHAIEALQSLVENRKGGETGISSVEVLYGDRLWEGLRAGKWPFELAAAAMELETGRKFTPDTKIIDPPGYDGWATSDPHGIIIQYKDGLKGYILKLGANALRWNFACRFKNESRIQATQFFPGPWKLRNLFRALSHSIQHFFVHRESPYPVERTLLANGAILAAVDGYAQPGRSVATPHLEFRYESRDFRRFREMGESWTKLIREGMPEPEGISPFFR